MEDLFEGLLGLLVVMIPLLIKRKNNKKERPGRKKKTAPKPASALEKLDKALETVETVLDDWAEDEEDAPAAAESRPEMQPQYLQPEPLVPEMLQAERLQETGMSEGQSHTDEYGCLGGSLPHETEEHHQGEDFHPQGVHELFHVQRDRREEIPQVQRVKPAVSAADLRKAVIWKEILDQPVSLRE